MKITKYSWWIGGIIGIIIGLIANPDLVAGFIIGITNGIVLGLLFGYIIENIINNSRRMKQKYNTLINYMLADPSAKIHKENRFSIQTTYQTDSTKGSFNIVQGYKELIIEWKNILLLTKESHYKKWEFPDKMDQNKMVEIMSNDMSEILDNIDYNSVYDAIDEIVISDQFLDSINNLTEKDKFVEDINEKYFGEIRLRLIKVDSDYEDGDKFVKILVEKTIGDKREGHYKLISFDPDQLAEGIDENGNLDPEFYISEDGTTLLKQP